MKVCLSSSHSASSGGGIGGISGSCFGAMVGLNTDVLASLGDLDLMLGRC